MTTFFRLLKTDIDAKGERLYPADQVEKLHIIRCLLDRGANLDLGLAQINSDNLEWLGLSPEAVFDPQWRDEGLAALAGTDVLVVDEGEAFMRADNPGLALSALLG